MITDAQYAAWLDDSTAQRVTLYWIGVNSGLREKGMVLPKAQRQRRSKEVRSWSAGCNARDGSKSIGDP